MARVRDARGQDRSQKQFTWRLLSVAADMPFDLRPGRLADRPEPTSHGTFHAVGILDAFPIGCPYRLGATPTKREKAKLKALAEP